MIERLLVRLARRIATHYGWVLVRATPAHLLPSRVLQIEQRIAKSGHLARRFNVRSKLDADVAELRRQVERL